MMKIRLLMLAVLLTFFASVTNAQDMSEYYTVMHPEDFTIDWTGFYKLNNENSKLFKHAIRMILGIK